MTTSSALHRSPAATPAWAVVVAVLTIGCGSKPPGGDKPAPAAKVQNAKPESDLASITLSPEAEKHLALQTAEVARVAVAESRTVGGEAIVAPGRSVVITAPLAGTLTAVSGRAPSVGPVAKDAVLFSLMPLQPADRDAMGSAEREAQEAAARLVAFDQRVKRLEGLLKEGSASLRSVEEARAERAIAAAAETAATRKLAALRGVPTGAGGALSLVAPFDGVITAVRAAAGQTVAAGAPIADVAFVGSLWIRVPLYAGDVGQIEASRASVAALGHETSGPWRDVQRVTGPPTANAGAASVDLFYELSPAGAIRPGERVAIRLALARATATKALVIPASAVVYDLQGGTWVYEVKAPHTFARRRVEISGPSGSSVVISRGLTEGLRIVTVGAAELYGTEFYVSK